jgi:hypothetical protein
MYLQLPSINPYAHQQRMFKAAWEGKNVCAVIHRRAGKDIGCLQLWTLLALRRIGTHVYLFPQYSQARSVIWNGMDFDGRPFISNIPECIIAKKNEARMEIDLINGSRLVLAGSNNYNSLMGTNPVSIIYSEYSLHNPLARQYLNPILVQNGGQEILNYTPRGKNHGWELFDTVRYNPRYHVEHLSVEQTYKQDGSRIITVEQIETAKKMGMSDEMIRQEFYCDFDVGNLGAYFTREMADMDREGRITTLPPNPNLPLHSIWDLGGTDATAGWLFQIEGNYINLLYLIQDTGQSLKYFLEKADQVRRSFNCQWGNHWMPHDVKQAHQGWEQAESRLMMARKAGWMFQVTPKVNFDDGIEAMRYIFPKLRMDKNNCSLGVRALREYARHYDELNACFRPKPIHNWTSHIADALRYLAVNYRRLYDYHQAPQKYGE